MPLRISTTQIQKLDIARDREFVVAMSQYLVERFELAAKPDFEFAGLVDEVVPIVTQAGKLGLPRYDGYALHVLASYILGIDYHEMPDVAPVLHSEKLSGDLKALWLEKWFHSLEDAAMTQAKV